MPKACSRRATERPASHRLPPTESTWFGSRNPVLRFINLSDGRQLTIAELSKPIGEGMSAPQYHLDLKRAVAIGHSSGGQLAFWLAARGKLPKSSPLSATSPLPLNGVVSVDGPPDLEADRAIEGSVCGGPVVTQFIGGTPTQFPDRYREGSASGLLPLGVRQELLLAGQHGEEWIRLFKEYVAKAEKAGDQIRMPTMESAGHFDGINPQATAWTTVMNSVQRLLR